MNVREEGVAAQWKPTGLEIMMATMQVLTDYDRLPTDAQADALFLHGSPAKDADLDKNLLVEAAAAIARGDVARIVLNGLTHEACAARGIAYQGYEEWKNWLQHGDVPQELITLIDPAPHTGAEARGFLGLAKKHGWRDLVIGSQPHHILRCMLQHVAMMKELEFWPRLYAMAAPGISVTRMMVKPVMGGATVHDQGDVSGTLLDHVERELESLVRYAQPPEVVDGKPKFTRNATIPELLEYLSRRDSGEL